MFVNTLSVRMVTIPVERKFLWIFKWKQQKTFFHLERPLVYESKVLGGFVIVPADFWTDLASHPIITLGFAPPYDSAPAAVVHDLLYSLRFYFKENEITGEWEMKYITDRRLSDMVLAEALEAVGFTGIRAWMWYQGVRFGGKGAWSSREDAPDLRFDVDYIKTLSIPTELKSKMAQFEKELARFNLGTGVGVPAA